jgi:hypothetical protein
MITVNSGRQTTMNDDFGDQFPGAVPSPATTARAQDRVVRMQAAYAQKVDALVQADREDLALELSDAFVEESAGLHPHARRDAGRRTPTRNPNGRRPGGGQSRLGRMGRLTRSSLNRFDRYTLDVFNPRSSYRSDRSV